ncbi:MAG: hybrid sensor histidine kinase/response regulator [Deltaproteobacteria bacterium]|nr:hybrid sensor histidine kinase/response regulator [Deltaproteobacteria bacterium]
MMARQTVLVVDDEPASVRTVQRTLADQCQVLTAGSGPEGLRLLESESVALIIADHRMPEMTGTEFLARSATLHPDAIRVLLTGYTDIDTVVGAINTGQVYYYLTKPWEARELQLVVQRGLERYEAEQERRRLLRELEQACGRARREAEQKGRLLTMAAHELGTPLHVLLNALDLLSMLDLPASAEPWLRTAQRNTDWLARGLAQMSTAARARNDGLRLRPALVQLAGLWTSVCDELRAHMSTRALTLTAQVADGLPTIEADATWLHHAVMGVVSNAIRFTPDGGSVTITAAAATDRVTLSVRDTGIGIDPVHVEDIFEPFSAAGGDPFLHASGSLAFGARGLGLGLAITRAIVTLHGGTISVVSTPRVGSCFTIELPLRFKAVPVERMK